MQYSYKLALLEGEGLGTAYEYFVKLMLLNKYFKKNKIKNVLIYGLPEKYGFSLDFIYFCYKNNLNVFLFEKRGDKIKKFKEILSKLNKKIIVNNLKIIKKIDKKYDLVLSCEVLQVLKENELKEYVNNIQKYSKRALIFVPNKSNKSHIKFSRLNGFTLKELNFLFNNVKKLGYIDVPPFPPGIKKEEKIKNIFLIVNKVAHTLLTRELFLRKQKFLVKTLEFFAYVERFIPLIIKKYTAHINYVLIENNKEI